MRCKKDSGTLEVIEGSPYVVDHVDPNFPDILCVIGESGRIKRLEIDRFDFIQGDYDKIIKRDTHLTKKDIIAIYPCVKKMESISDMGFLFKGGIFNVERIKDGKYWIRNNAGVLRGYMPCWFIDYTPEAQNKIPFEGELIENPLDGGELAKELSNSSVDTAKEESSTLDASNAIDAFRIMDAPDSFPAELSIEILNCDHVPELIRPVCETNETKLKGEISSYAKDEKHVEKLKEELATLISNLETKKQAIFADVEIHNSIVSAYVKVFRKNLLD